MWVNRENSRGNRSRTRRADMAFSHNRIQQVLNVECICLLHASNFDRWTRNLRMWQNRDEWMRQNNSLPFRAVFTLLYAYWIFVKRAEMKSTSERFNAELINYFLRKLNKTTGLEHSASSSCWHSQKFISPINLSWFYKWPCKFNISPLGEISIRWSKRDRYIYLYPLTLSEPIAIN